MAKVANAVSNRVAGKVWLPMRRAEAQERNRLFILLVIWLIVEWLIVELVIRLYVDLFIWVAVNAAE